MKSLSNFIAESNQRVNESKIPEEIEWVFAKDPITELFDSMGMDEDMIEDFADYDSFTALQAALSGLRFKANDIKVAEHLLTIIDTFNAFSEDADMDFNPVFNGSMLALLGSEFAGVADQPVKALESFTSLDKSVIRRVDAIKSVDIKKVTLGEAIEFLKNYFVEGLDESEVEDYL